MDAKSNDDTLDMVVGEITSDVTNSPVLAYHSLNFISALSLKIFTKIQMSDVLTNVLHCLWLSDHNIRGTIVKFRSVFD